jgi:hypothetical protein
MRKHPLRPLLLGGVVAIAALAGGQAPAQTAAPPPPPAATAPGPVYDPSGLPVTKGTVARYSLTPRGDVDGLILGDGTEVHLPPHLGTQLVYAVRPGDAVTVRGLRALRLPLVSALSVTNDATGATVVDNGPPPPPGKRGPREAAGASELSAQGRVQAVLHGPRGEANGALLDDGTELRLPPPEAERLADLLAPGKTLAARGPGLSSPLGTVIEVRRIGPSADQLADVAPPPPPPGGPKGHHPPPPPAG